LLSPLSLALSLSVATTIFNSSATEEQQQEELQQKEGQK